MDENVINNKDVKKGLTEEIASRKRSINFMSLGTCLPDPDPILRKSGKDVTVYKNLSADPHVFACMTSRKSGVLSKKWDFISEKGENDKTLEFIKELFKSLDVHRLISDILNAPFYGFQPIEIIWTKKGQYIIPSKLIAKPSDWFCYDEENNLKFRSKENYYGEDLPERKFLNPQSNPTYENPYGDRVFSRVYWSVVFKKNGLKFWVVFCEKYGMPHIVGHHPRGSSQDEVSQLADLLEKMVQDAVAVIPDDSSVEIMEANKTSSSDVYGGLIEKMNAEISKAILGQTLSTEVGNVGSFAASKSHLEVRDEIIRADATLVETTINQFIRWICEINFSNEADFPRFTFLEEDHIGLELAQRDKTLTETGVVFSKKYYIKKYGFNEDDIEAVNTNTLPQSELSHFKEIKKIDGQAELDSMLDYLDKNELDKQAKSMFTELLDSVEKTASFTETNKKLNSKKINTEDFQEFLARVLFLAQVFGRLDGLNE